MEVLTDRQTQIQRTLVKRESNKKIGYVLK